MAFYKGFLVSYHYIQVWVLIYTYYIICNVPTGIPNNDMNITQVNCCGLVSISIIYCTNYCYMYINEKFNFDVIINCILFLELLLHTFLNSALKGE